MASVTTYQTGTNAAFATIAYMGRGKAVAWPTVGAASGGGGGGGGSSTLPVARPLNLAIGISLSIALLVLF